LARLDEIEPDERALQERAAGGPSLSAHRPQESPNRVIIAVVALIVAIVPLAVVIIAFRSGPTPTTGVAADEAEGVITYAGVSNARWVLFTVRPDGSGNARVPIDGLPDDANHPVWSPDGTQIAFDMSSPGPSPEEGGNLDVYVVDADGSDLTRLTTEDGWDYQPVWSPDGSQIAFVRSRPSEDIWVMDADGTNPARLTDGGSFDLSPSWSPDGTHLAFVSNRSRSPEIYTMDADGTNVTRLTHNAAYEGSVAWSPDGSQIAFAGDVDGPGVYLASIAGDQLSKVVAARQVGPLTLSWSPDGSAIAFVTQQSMDAPQQLRVLDVSSGMSSTIVSGTDLCCPSWSHPSAPSSSAVASDVPTESVPSRSPDPAVEATGQDALEVRGVPYAVCRLMRLPGDFDALGDELLVFEEERVPGAGCVGSEGFQHIAIAEDGEVTSMSDRITDLVPDGAAWKVWPYATPDLDGDGSDEIALAKAEGWPSRRVWLVAVVDGTIQPVNSSCRDERCQVGYNQVIGSVAHGNGAVTPEGLYCDDSSGQRRLVFWQVSAEDPLDVILLPAYLRGAQLIEAELTTVRVDDQSEYPESGADELCGSTASARSEYPSADGST
jgi:Tol biopolymer transport system component